MIHWGRVVSLQIVLTPAASWAVQTTLQVGTITQNYRPEFLVYFGSALAGGDISGDGKAALRNLSNGAITGSHSFMTTYVAHEDASLS